MKNLTIGQRVDRAIDQMQRHLDVAAQAAQRMEGLGQPANFQHGQVDALTTALAIVRNILPAVEDGK